MLLLQHTSDPDEVISRKNTNLSTSSMMYSSRRLLHRVTVASSVRQPFCTCRKEEWTLCKYIQIRIK